MKLRVNLLVNGERHETLVAVHKTLLEVLREDLGLIGTKHGCELGECGTCTVLVGGPPPPGGWAAAPSSPAWRSPPISRAPPSRRSRGWRAAASCTRCSRP